MKLPSFPRKALEADLALYSRGPLGSTLLGLDVLHKFMYVMVIHKTFGFKKFALKKGDKILIKLILGGSVL